MDEFDEYEKGREAYDMGMSFQPMQNEHWKQGWLEAQEDDDGLYEPLGQ